MFLLLGFSVQYLWNASKKRMAAAARRKTSTMSKADVLRNEVKTIENLAKKKANKMNTASREEEAKTQEACDQLKSEVERLTKMAGESNEAHTEATGWEQQVVSISERMKQTLQREAEAQRRLVLKADEATNDIDFRSQYIRRELPGILDFSEEDRVQLITAMEKSINDLKLKKSSFEDRERKLLTKMELLVENTLDPAANKEELITKLKLSYDVVSGANDPEKAREELLKVLSADHVTTGSTNSNPKGNNNKTATPKNKGSGSKSQAKGV